MRSNLWAIGILAGVWACGGTTDVGTFGGDGGTSSGGSSGSSSGSSGGGSSSGGSGSSGGGSGSSGGGSSGSSSGAATDSGAPRKCPASPPTSGSCPSVGFECEYGSDPSVNCNELVTCEPSGWTVAELADCPQGTCPSAYSDIQPAETCSPQGLDCAYAEGQCNCAREALSANQNAIWQCATPSPGCPEPRPRLGDACAQAGLSCDYGACNGGIDVACTDGAWQRAETACPARASGASTR
jgi:hypothetical protein